MAEHFPRLTSKKANYWLKTKQEDNSKDDFRYLENIFEAEQP